MTTGTKTLEKYVPMNVHLPFGEKRRVMTISSDLYHLGNRVAEKDLHPSMFWPELARIKSTQLKRLERQVLAQQEKTERKAYANMWVLHWLDNKCT